MHNRGPSRIVWTCVRSAGSGQLAPQRAVGEDVGFAGVELAIGTTLRWLRALTAHTAVQHVRVDGIRLQNWYLRGRPEDTPGRRGQQFSLRFVGTCRCVLPLFRNWRGGPVAPPLSARASGTCSRLRSGYPLNPRCLSTCLTPNTVGINRKKNRFLRPASFGS